MSWDPITGVCVVEDRTMAPADYEVIHVTTDNCDADLWKDKKMRKRITRYLAFTRKRLAIGDKVLADISVIKDDQPYPFGYTCIQFTTDSKETVLKKKSLIVRFVERTETKEAITDIYITSGKARSKPVESTSRGWEIKDLALYLRFGTVIQSPLPASVPNAAPLPYQYPARSNSLQNEHSPSPPIPQDRLGISRQGLSRQATMRSPEQQAQMTAIDGVPFQLHPLLVAMAVPDTISVPALHLKTREEILRIYEYDFATEKLVKKQAAFTT